MAVLYLKLCYNKVCYNGTTLYSEQNMAKKYKSTITDLSYPMAQETRVNRQATVINCLSLSSISSGSSLFLTVPI